MDKERIGEWFVIEHLLDYSKVNRILSYQKHGDKRQFGQIALSNKFIRREDLDKWMKSQTY